MSTRVEGGTVIVLITAHATLSAGHVRLSLSARQDPAPGTWRYRRRHRQPITLRARSRNPGHLDGSGTPPASATPSVLAARAVDRARLADITAHMVRSGVPTCVDPSSTPPGARHERGRPLSRATMRSRLASARLVHAQAATQPTQKSPRRDL